MSDEDQKPTEQSTDEGDPSSALLACGLIKGSCSIGLHGPKTPANVGAALRACGVYGANMLAMSGKRVKPGSTDTMKAHRRIPFLAVDDLKSVIPYGAIPIAVDLVPGAKPLHTYAHPKHAFYVFGPEDGTLGNNVTSWCKETIYIPTMGCMNLAATINVVLYDRMAKMLWQTNNQTKPRHGGVVFTRSAEASALVLC